MRDCTPGAIENWSDWFRHNAWQGVEPHMFLQDGFSPESLRHPYLKWIRIIENEMYPDRYRRGIVDGNLEIINHQGGSTGKKWGGIVSGPGEGKSKILHQTTVPKLVVVNNRFCLLSLIKEDHLQLQSLLTLEFGDYWLHGTLNLQSQN